MVKIYNTLKGKKEVLKPFGAAPADAKALADKQGKKLKLFVCGPTVYDFSHLGHARTYIFFDFFVKYLRFLGCNVSYLQNITDIDDKIIQRAKERSENPRKLAREMEREYLRDMKSLGIDSVSKYARATEHIKEIISQVERLFRKGYGYQISDGIYYDISKFKNYGKLSGRNTEQAEDAVSRIDESVQKRNKGDFALWKFSRPGDPMWDFQTSKYLGVAGPAYAKASAGKPGWHIEDTAITEKYFGPQYDIHGGAIDLLFPHHEAEIAQMEALSGKKPMVKYWLHAGFLTVRGEKMAKSLGNFITIRDFLKNHSLRLGSGQAARTLRLFVLKSHYRSPIDYSEKAILQTEKELERIDEFVEKLGECGMKHKTQKSALDFKLQVSRFWTALEDDFNTPEAVAVIFELIRKGNILLTRNKINGKDVKEILRFLKEVDDFFQFIFWGKEKKEIIPKNILELAAKREKERQQKNWKKSDDIRKKIKKLGYWVEDTKNGAKIKKLR